MSYTVTRSAISSASAGSGATAPTQSTRRSLAKRAGQRHEAPSWSMAVIFREASSQLEPCVEARALGRSRYLRQRPRCTVQWVPVFLFKLESRVQAGCVQRHVGGAIATGHRRDLVVDGTAIEHRLACVLRSPWGVIAAASTRRSSLATLSPAEALVTEGHICAAVLSHHAEGRQRYQMTPNPSIERTSQRPLRAFAPPLMSNVRPHK